MIRITVFALTADHFFAVSENLNLDSLVKAGNLVIHKDLYLAPIEIGQVVQTEQCVLRHR